MDSINTNEILICARCDTKLQIPRTNTSLKITCPNCQHEFYHNLPPQPEKRNNKLIKSMLIWAGVLILSVIIFAWLNQDNTHTGSIKKKFIPSARNSSNWITISYGDLVDKGILTHNGESVGEIIYKIPQYDDEYKGLVKPYLEPFSILCHDGLL